MHRFETTITWRHDKQCLISARDKPGLEVATPPEFGGPGGTWSPEELLVASVGSCLMSTFLYFASWFKLPFRSYSSTSSGTLEKTTEGLRFTGIDVSIAITVPEARAAKKVLKLKETLEKHCPVSTALRCPVRLAFEVNAEPDGGDGGEPAAGQPSG